MIRINLLPWREQLREQLKKEFFIYLGLAVLGTVGMISIIYFFTSIKITDQDRANQFLNDQISQLDQKIAEVQNLKKEKAELIAHLTLITQLEVSRLDVVHEFDSLVHVMPKGIYLTEVDKNGLKMTLMGKAESNTRVSELMRNMELSPWFESPVLTVIKANDDLHSTLTRDFQLDVDLTPSVEEKEQPASTNTPTGVSNAAK